MTNNTIITALLETMPNDVQKQLLVELKTKHETKPKEADKPTQEELDKIFKSLFPGSR